MHPRAVARCGHEARLLQDLEVAAGVGDRHGDLSGQLFDTALAVGQHIDDLDPAPAGQRLGGPSELIEELGLDGSVRHWSALCTSQASLSCFQLIS